MWLFQNRIPGALYHLTLRWLGRLKNDQIHQKYDVFKSIIFKALERLQRAF